MSKTVVKGEESLSEIRQSEENFEKGLIAYVRTGFKVTSIMSQYHDSGEPLPVVGPNE